MIDINENLWLQYIKAIEKHNAIQLKLQSKEISDGKKELEAALKAYNSLPWYKRLFKTVPYQRGLWPFTRMEPFIRTASLEGYLTWKAKGKKL